jgi:hypothetical protein
MGIDRLPQGFQGAALADQDAPYGRSGRHHDQRRMSRLFRQPKNRRPVEVQAWLGNRGGGPTAACLGRSNAVSS